MSKFIGKIITNTQPASTGGKSGTASAVWGLSDELQRANAGTWPAPKTVPGAPTIGTATAVSNSTSVNVTYTAPTDNGGYTITS